MSYLQFTTFRNNSKEYFDKIEKGQSFIIIRRGKPIAQILPVNENIKGWKRKIKQIELPENIDTIDYIRSGRDA